MVLGAGTDCVDVAELVTESYRLLAPVRLCAARGAIRVAPPNDGLRRRTLVERDAPAGRGPHRCAAEHVSREGGRCYRKDRA